MEAVTLAGFTAFAAMVGFWFWAILIVGMLGIFVSSIWENWASATLTFLAMVISLNWIYGLNIHETILDHPWWLFVGFAAYFGMGVCTAIVKWILFLSERGRIYEEIKKESTDKIDLFNRLRDRFGLYYRTAYSEVTIKQEDIFPPARKHKSRIVYWIAYWPWVALWTLLDDPLRRFVNWLYYRVAGIFNYLSKFVANRYRFEEVTKLQGK